jgi:hypothetical protein
MVLHVVNKLESNAVVLNLLLMLIEHFEYSLFSYLYLFIFIGIEIKNIHNFQIISFIAQKYSVVLKSISLNAVVSKMVPQQLSKDFILCKYVGVHVYS